MTVNLEIEGVFKITNRGHFIIAKRLDPKHNFYITKKSLLGGIELMEYLDIPRSIDENGNQRDVVALQLKNSGDAPKLAKGSIVELQPVDSILYLEPWIQIATGSAPFEDELKKELSPKHVLYSKKLRVTGKRADNDDILVEVEDNQYPFAIVHLTWGQRPETGARYPRTELFKSWLDLYNNRIVPDHEQYG